MGASIRGCTAALPHVDTDNVSALARMLVDAEDDMAAFTAGPMFVWLVGQAIERRDSRFDCGPHMGTYAANRWLPVLFDIEDTPFEALHPVHDSLALTIAVAELSGHTEHGTEGGIVAIRCRVAAAIEARYGVVAAEDYDVDRVVDRMLAYDEPQLDDWNFGTFWLVVEDSRRTDRSPSAWEDEIYELMVGELLCLQDRYAENPEDHGKEYYDFLHSPMFAWLWGELAERDDDRTDWESLQFDCDENRWTPVLDAFGGYSLDVSPGELCDAESYLAAAAELSIHGSSVQNAPDGGDGSGNWQQSVRCCVANTLDRRHGPGTAERFDLDAIIAAMIEIDAETPDDWDFGTFWVVVNSQE